MNKIEKIVYDILKSNPKLKLKIRNIYQDFYDFLPDRENYFFKECITKKGYFFGFHDVSPWSNDEEHVLSNKLEIGLRMPTTIDPLVVGFWDKNLSNFTPVKQTHAWNYHKGCRLQWLGKNNQLFIFNDSLNGKLVSNIYSIKGNLYKHINFPIDTVSMNGKFATSFSYERLNRYMPGYGYDYKDEAYFDENASNNTGLFLIDIEKNERKLIVPLSILSKLNVEQSMNGAHHYVTHTEFSPDDERISFLHRWTFDDPNKRYTRLVTCKLDGSDIYISNTSGMVSHYDWDEEHGILAYAQVDGVDGHYLFNNYKMDNSVRVCEDLNSDGHQSYIPETNLFITDTYPDKRRYAKLYLCDLTNNSSIKIAELKHPKKFQSPNVFKHWCCDLHPRVSPSGKYVSFDSVYDGERSFCVMKLQ